MRLRLKWWKVAGFLAYYAMFLNVGAAYGIVAFLFGFAFGELWAKPRNHTNSIPDLASLLPMYLTIAFPLFVIVWSSAYLSSISGALKSELTSKLFLSVAAILLLYLSYFFHVKALNTENVVRRLRWCITCGPVISGSLTGMAGIVLAIESFGVVAENFWWISLTLLVTSLLPVMLFVILLVLLSLVRPAMRPPPQKAAG